ncbi:RloB family protein [uncultured Turicimonas sp.]|uniref:RloB family protein n=1 Tax=uncultured Turicimonas sp. TaxID=1918607 RepID=UPI0028049357|nr:RloB family protein [uncultured Turicimonas sp.]
MKPNTEKRKQTKRFNFSVEGETEKWYLEWLRDVINKEPARVFNVSFNIKVEKNPVKMVKFSSPMVGEIFFHFFDFESQYPAHVKQRNETFKLLKEAKNRKKIQYEAAYSNFSFELWILLHKTQLNQSFSDRKQYLPLINKYFGTAFADLREFKIEKNFKSVLNSLNFSDVQTAMNNYGKIVEQCELNLIEKKTCGYSFYEENPSSSVGETIQIILKACKLSS